MLPFLFSAVLYIPFLLPFSPPLVSSLFHGAHRSAVLSLPRVLIISLQLSSSSFLNRKSFLFDTRPKQVRQKFDYFPEGGQFVLQMLRVLVVMERVRLCSSAAGEASLDLISSGMTLITR